MTIYSREVEDVDVNMDKKITRHYKVEFCLSYTGTETQQEEYMGLLDWLVQWYMPSVLEEQGETDVDVYFAAVTDEGDEE